MKHSGRPNSLYFHIPFCRARCNYCDFYSVADRDEQIPLFLDALITELRSYTATLRQYSGIETLYLGGGTPSMFTGEQVEELLAVVTGLLPLQDSAEITLEANPGEVDEARLRAYKRAGVNRLSLGLQSFRDHQLHKLGRIHTAQQNTDTVTMAREAGFDNISVDLLFHLPGQTLSDFRDDLEKILSLNAEHVSIYSLTVEANTPLFRYVQQGDVQMPSDDLDAEMYSLICQSLAEEGYEHYEVSNFCKPGYRSRHNSNCWNGSHYIGFGPSAHSYTGNQRWWNVRDLSKYLQLIRGDLSPTEGREQSDTLIRQEEFLLTRLRTSGGISREKWREEFGEPLPEAISHYLIELAERCPDWVRVDDESLRLTEHGWLFNDTIIEECSELLVTELTS